MRINDNRVSRQHAELYWDGEGFILHDLQSSNGTWVNDDRVDTVDLSDGDKVEIGPEHFLYRQTKSRKDVEAMRNQIRRKTARLCTEVVPEMQLSEDGGELRGALDSVPITEVVQMLNVTNRTGLLVVRSGSGKALLYFFKGEVTQAEHFLENGEVLLGDEAFLSTVPVKEGSFAFKPDHQGTNDNVDSRTQTLLFEAARLVDEASRGSIA
ncbi:MAG: DUF4388 domain-containing protein [Planctomycetota bacterium]